MPAFTESFPPLVERFRGRRLPIPARLAGYSALIERFDLSVPLHHEMWAVADRNTLHEVTEIESVYADVSGPGRPTTR